MKKDKVIIVTLLIIGLVIAWKKIIMRAPNTLQPNPVPTSGGRSLNNPGNIKTSATKYDGELENKEALYTSFVSIEYGYRAIAVILKAYYKRGLKNLAAVIKEYSGNDNAVEYANYVGQKIGLFSIYENDIGFILDDDHLLSIVISAMAQWEQGKTFAVNENDVKKGIDLA